MTDFDRNELAALQAFDDAYNEAWGWPSEPIDPCHPIQQATLRALKAAAPLLTAPRDYQDAMSEPSQAAYIAEQLRLESEGDR